MSNTSHSKRGYAVAIALVALLLGGAAGAAAVLWMWKSGIAAAPTDATEAVAPAGGPCNGKPAKLYRNPMGAPDTSPVPKKDSMGMDYIPVCEDTEERGGLKNLDSRLSGVSA